VNQVVLQARFDLEGGEPIHATLTRVAEASGAASAPRSPATDHSRMANLTNWNLWLEGRTIHALSAVGGEPSQATLSAPPTVVVAPALMGPGGELDVLVASGRELSLVRFRELMAEADPGKVLASTQLDDAPLAAVAALSPRDALGRRHVALVANGNEGPVLTWVAFSPSGELAGVRASKLAGAGLDHDARPGLHVGEGTTTAGLVTRTGPKRYALVEARFGSEEVDSLVATTAWSYELPNPVARSRVSYLQQGQTVRRAVVLLDAEGELYVVSGDRLTRTGRWPERELVEPVLLPEGCFLVAADPRAGLVLKEVG
jgi:hypothetical protein